jgi:hypothetical protein
LQDGGTANSGEDTSDIEEFMVIYIDLWQWVLRHRSGFPFKEP